MGQYLVSGSFEKHELQARRLEQTCSRQGILARGSAVSWVMRADGKVEGAVAVAITRPLYKADRHQRTRLVQQVMAGDVGRAREVARMGA